ncbi:transmembrane protein 154 isoform X2 [Macrotis lagotis]|uniref:transmembrane protein 154 isoform X2 n=1 Tax=Macrotis lagotis TaxID=92651 RepID=UPI003D68A09E
MPEKGQGNLRTPGFLIIISLLLGKHSGFASDPEYSGEGSHALEAIPSQDQDIKLSDPSFITNQREDDARTVGDPQILATTPPVLSERESVVDLETLLMVGIPLGLLLLLSLLVVFLVRYNKRRKSKPVPSSQGSQSALQSYELGSENVKSPIFEEDTPSVMEIEMEELDKWMNSINRNAECECLPTVKEEEKESNHNQSDAEP